MTASLAATGALDAPLRLLSALTDSAASAAVRRPTRLRVRLSARGVLAARADRVTVTVGDVSVAGLDVAFVRLDARRVLVQPGWPPRLRAGPVELRITLTQAALDRWLLADAMPLRLRLRSSGLSLRAGAVGVRLAEVGADIAVEGGRLVVIANRAQVLGVTVPTAAMRLPLPLPPLPWASQLTSVDVVEGAVTVTVRVDEVDEPLTPVQARRLGRLLRAAA